MKLTTTRFTPETGIAVGHFGDSHWQHVDTSDHRNAQVGPVYRTKSELLTDHEDYLTRAGWKRAVEVVVASRSAKGSIDITLDDVVIVLADAGEDPTAERAAQVRAAIDYDSIVVNPLTLYRRDAIMRAVKVLAERDAALSSEGSGGLATEFRVMSFHGELARGGAEAMADLFNRLIREMPAGNEAVDLAPYLKAVSQQFSENPDFLSYGGWIELDAVGGERIARFQFGFGERRELAPDVLNAAATRPQRWSLSRAGFERQALQSTLSEIDWYIAKYPNPAWNARAVNYKGHGTAAMTEDGAAEKTRAMVAVAIAQLDSAGAISVAVREALADRLPLETILVSNRRYCVGKALAFNQPVPESVLADFPDVVARYRPTQAIESEPALAP
ncbi:hypothetical protein R70006_04946 [Paraburkholderia domus]|uniref:hypothetical protein n=1 Tax=Paraburkholderia domus TaxID=2793075 RepID=UPI001911AEF2|nr:hypothetical protein [Paraburkholderia domus]MBK5051818.1 hypothetical protein [Burkholderia sp. R-70006]CAE6793216.1 hypothetical protein R70006_04946 [Paraburkholderia domus]